MKVTNNVLEIRFLNPVPRLIINVRTICEQNCFLIQIKKRRIQSFGRETWQNENTSETHA
jgi:hypothetical protein